MTVQSDCSITMVAETVYGTPVTTSRGYEFLSETFDLSPTFVQGQGMRVGTRADRAGRRKVGKSSVGGDLVLEAASKGLGLLFLSGLGTQTTTVIGATSAYQQVHTPATTDYLKSFTIQKGIPPLGGGATLPHTFAGCMCTSWEATISNAGILQLKFSYMGKAVDTSTTYAAPAYPASPLEDFVFSEGAITVGGSVTLPTTTALATGGTAIADIRDWSLTWDNKLDTNGFNLGSAGLRSRAQAITGGDGKGKITAEFDAVTLRDAYINQTDLAMVVTFTSKVLIGGTSYPTLQFVIPDIRLEGELPKSNAGDVVTQTINYTVLDGQVAASPLYVVYVSTDTAP